jgi:hypothetical protein
VVGEHNPVSGITADMSGDDIAAALPTRRPPSMLSKVANEKATPRSPSKNPAN